MKRMHAADQGSLNKEAARGRRPRKLFPCLDMMFRSNPKQGMETGETETVQVFEKPCRTMNHGIHGFWMKQ
jgi:hypothetical protein